MPRKQVIRVGDMVRIVNSKFVKRAGYPLIWYDLKDEVENDIRTWRAWQALTGEAIPARFGEPVQEQPLWLAATLELPREFIKAVAMQRVRERRFGGNVRSLIYCEPPLPAEPGKFQAYDPDRPGDWTNHRLRVDAKKVVKTGKRSPAGGYGEDYWDGYLADEKTHVLLQAGPGWLEECNVELVRREDK
jgi:hypothetical protein